MATLETPPQHSNRDGSLDGGLNLWQRLVEPRPHVSDPEHRRLCRLLASGILLFMLLLSISLAIQVRMAPDVRAVLPGIGAGMLVGVGCFFLARSGRHVAATFVFSGVLILVCLVGVYDRPLDPIWEGVITVAVVFASLFLPVPQLAVIAGFAMVATVIGALTVPDLVQAGYSAPIIVYQLTVIGLLILARRHREGMEEARRAHEQRRDKELADARRMETLGRLAGGVAHDFNNYLMVIGANTSLLESQGGLTEKQRQMLGEISSTTVRAADLTRQLLTFGIRQPRRRRAFDLRSAVAATEALLRSAIGSTIDFRMTLEETPLAVMGDEGQIGQVLLNLVINARNAQPDGGSVQVDLKHVTLQGTMAQEASVEPGDYAALQVVDAGVGMSPETQERAFEPFFTDRPDGQGTGLGLANAFTIIKGHGGVIRLESEQGAGTTVQVLLPLTGARLPTAASPPVARPTRVLVVDNDPLVRVSVARILVDAGHHVVQASSVDAALEALDGQAEPIELVLTDVVMPGKRGTVLARRLEQIRPEMRLSFMSAFTGGDDAELAGWPVLAKPFTASALLRHVAKVAQSPAADAQGRTDSAD